MNTLGPAKSVQIIKVSLFFRIILYDKVPFGTSTKCVDGYVPNCHDNDGQIYYCDSSNVEQWLEAILSEESGKFFQNSARNCINAYVQPTLYG